MKIGCIAELECMTAFVKLGYMVSIPYGDCAKYDFIADVNGKLLRIQVKTSSKMESGFGFKFPTRNSRGHKYTDEIDAFMTSYDGQLYFIPIEESSMKEQKLWFKPPQDCQKVKFASEYLLCFQLDNLNGST